MRIVPLYFPLTFLEIHSNALIYKIVSILFVLIEFYNYIYVILTYENKQCIPYENLVTTIYLW